MSAPKQPGSTPTAIAVDLTTAAGLLDVSLPTFTEAVLPHLRVIEITPRCRRVAVCELERWADEASVNGNGNAEAVR